MKFVVLSALALPGLVAAHGYSSAYHHVRQAATTTTTTSAADADNSAADSAAEVGATGNTNTLPTKLTFSLASSNPTAIPLSLISTGTAQTQSTIPLSTTDAPGSVPTDIPNAPGLPDAIALNPENYPHLDLTPPTDSDLVQQWVKEVMDSGIEIPDIPINNPGGCANNTAAAANASANCWWTCGGCVRETDITLCPNKNSWGVSYDDGPSLYTTDLLQYFQQQNIHSTFFVVGSRAISRPLIVQNEYMTGHQIAVHTWSHPEMTTRTNEQVIAELGWTRKVLRDITGVTPIYWRPPFGDIDDRVRAISIAMNLKPIIWTRINATMDFDTNDWGMIGGSSTAISTLDKWNEIMNVEANISTGFIALEHDLFEQTVDLAVGYILPEALAHQPKFNMTPIVECLDMPLANAYLETNDNSTNPPPLTAYLANRTIPGTTPPAGSSNSTGSSGGNPSASGSSDGSSGGSPGSSEKSGASSMMAVGPALLTAALGVVGSVGAIFL